MRPNEITDQVVIEMKEFISKYGMRPRVCLLPRKYYKKLLLNLAMEEYKQYTHETEASEKICGLDLIVTESNSIKVGIV